jgi:hypothetical protein
MNNDTGAIHPFTLSGLTLFVRIHLFPLKSILVDIWNTYNLHPGLRWMSIRLFHPRLRKRGNPHLRSDRILRYQRTLFSAHPFLHHFHSGKCEYRTNGTVVYDSNVRSQWTFRSSANVRRRASPNLSTFARRLRVQSESFTSPTNTWRLKSFPSYLASSTCPSGLTACGSRHDPPENRLTIPHPQTLPPLHSTPSQPPTASSVVNQSQAEGGSA